MSRVNKELAESASETRFIAIDQLSRELSDDAKSALSQLPEKLFNIVAGIYRAGAAGKCRRCLENEVGSLGTNGSGPIRDARNKGFQIPSTPKRGMGLCPVHPRETVTIDVLTTLEPNAHRQRDRAEYSSAAKAAITEALGILDNFELRPSEKLEIDHRVPMARRVGQEVPVDTTDPEAIRATYQMLSNQNNSKKRMRCIECVNTGKRPVFLGGLRYWPVGDENYDPIVGCDGCPWAYPEQYREGLESMMGQAAKGCLCSHAEADAQ